MAGPRSRLHCGCLQGWMLLSAWVHFIFPMSFFFILFLRMYFATGNPTIGNTGRPFSSIRLAHVAHANHPGKR